MDQMKDGIINTLLQRAHSYEENTQFTKATNCFERAWKKAKEGMKDTHITSVREYDLKFNNDEFLANWIQDFSLILLTSYEDTKDTSYLKKRIQFIDEAIPLLKQDVAIYLIFISEKAEALFLLGNKENAFSLLQEQLTEFSTWGSGYLKMAELYTENNQQDIALEVLFQAKDVPDIEELDEIDYQIARLKDR